MLTGTAHDFDYWAGRLFDAAAASYANESALRHGLYTALHPFLVDHLGLDPADIQHEGSSTSGRFDSLFGRVLVEYKSPGELESDGKRKTHARQAINYLLDEKIGADIVLLTDGRTWGILRDNPHADIGEQGWLELGLPVPSEPAERFQWRENSTGTARRVLELLSSIRSIPVSTASLVAHLGPDRREIRELLAALAKTLTSRGKGSRADILFEQWLQLAGVSYGISSKASAWPQDREAILGDVALSLPHLSYPETIFLLHSYVAYASKLIAAETLALSLNLHECRPSQWPSLTNEQLCKQLEALESGELAARLHAPRLMGGDLFGWYAPVIRENAELQSTVRNSLKSFAELAWARLTHVGSVTGDLLRDFYAAVVPRQLRKSLGEFFTPQWIAEKVVQRAISLAQKPEGRALRVLDPSCGSGTFLVTAFQHALLAAAARGLSRAEQAVEAIDSIYGIDINPVSPIMSRVNLLLALGDRVEELGDISFNVYQADSILIPEEHFGLMQLGEEGDLRIPLVIGDVMLPMSLSTLPRITALSNMIDQGLARNRDQETFKMRFAAELKRLGAASEEATQGANDAGLLYDRLRELHVKKQNGIWAHVIEQSFAPRVMPQMDLVVGNPPWISWKHLPKAWRERSEPVWQQWGLWQSKATGGGVPMSDISTLLLARSLATYCPSGVVAMLLPEGILVNEPGGRAIRSCRLDSHDLPVTEASKPRRFAPLHIDDFTSLNPFSPDASNRPIAIYLQSGIEPSFPITATVWKRSVTRATLRPHDTWTEATKVLKATDVVMQPMDGDDIASRWRPANVTGKGISLRPLNQPAGYTWGQGFHSRGADGIFYCELVSPRPMHGGLVRVRTRPDMGRNTRDVPSVEVEVEAEFVLPLVRGQSVHPFHVDSPSMYCLLPHDPQNLARILSVEELIRRAPRLYDYLEPHVPRLLGRSAYDMQLTATRPWGIQGTAWRHLTPSAHLVVARYMHPEKRPPAAVCSPRYYEELGRVSVVYPNNKVNFVACATPAEADYVAAFLNSDPILDLVAQQCSSTTIAPGAMNRLPVPKFSASHPMHAELSDIGSRCRALPGDWASFGDRGAALVTELARTLRPSLLSG